MFFTLKIIDAEKSTLIFKAGVSSIKTADTQGTYTCISLDLKPKVEVNAIQQTINTYNKLNVIDRIRNTFLGSSGKKAWSATLLTKLATDIGISAIAIPNLGNLISQGNIGLFAIGGMLYVSTVLAYSTWFSLMMVNSLSRLFHLNKVEDVKKQLEHGELPNITVQIPCRNEPFDVMKNTSIRSALALDYPKEKLTIQVVDNSETGKYEELQQYCKDNGIEFIHREGKEGGKARNLNIGLGLKPIDETFYTPKSDLYFLVDADIEFSPNILKKTLPEFKVNPKLPFVIFESDDYADDNLFNTSLATVNQASSHTIVDIEKFGFTTSGGYGLLYNRHAWNIVDGWKEGFVGEDWATGIAIRTA